jgi:hypothetical protein
VGTTKPHVHTDTNVAAKDPFCTNTIANTNKQGGAGGGDQRTLFGRMFHPQAEFVTEVEWTCLCACMASNGGRDARGGRREEGGAEVSKGGGSWRIL